MHILAENVHILAQNVHILLKIPIHSTNFWVPTYGTIKKYQWYFRLSGCPVYVAISPGLKMGPKK